MEIYANLLTELTVDNLLPVISISMDKIFGNLPELIPEPVAEFIADSLTLISPVWNEVIGALHDIAGMIF